MFIRQHTWKRTGGIAPLTCILMTFLLGMVAFAVDISWIAMSQSELQNSADAAALAGANALADNFVLHTLPSQSASNKPSLRSGAVTAAKTAARNYAAFHNAGSVGLTLLDSDIDVGYTNAAGTYTSFSANSSNFPNTVKVTMRRDQTANTSLVLFFAPVLGVSKMDLQAAATATLYTGTVTSFKVGTTNSAVLPVTFDVNDWYNFQNNGKDKAGNQYTDSSGNPKLQIWASQSDQGNFGLLSLDSNTGNASTLSSWIHDGLPPSDVQLLLNKNLLPVNNGIDLWDWNGATGFKAANAMDVNQHVGKTYLLPLYKPAVSTPLLYEGGVGQGSNYFYNIVEFVGVKVLPTSNTNDELWLQPAVVSDPNAILGNLTPANGSSTFATSFAVRLVN